MFCCPAHREETSALLFSRQRTNCYLAYCSFHLRLCPGRSFEPCLPPEAESPVSCCIAFPGCIRSSLPHQIRPMSATLLMRQSNALQITALWRFSRLYPVPVSWPTNLTYGIHLKNLSECYERLGLNHVFTRHQGLAIWLSTARHYTS